jgi:hypothetical protein
VTWGIEGQGLGAVEQDGWPEVNEVAFARLDRRVQGQSVLWTGRLPDGTDVYASVVTVADEPPRLVVAARQDGYVDLYVLREGPFHHEPNVLAVVVRGEDRDWLVVVTGPGVTAVDYAADGGRFAPMELRGGAAVAGHARGEVPRSARVRVTYDRDGAPTTEERPLDAYGPLG